MTQQVTKVKLTFRSTVSPGRDSIAADYFIEFDGPTDRPEIGRSMSGNSVPKQMVLDRAIADLFEAFGEAPVTDLAVEMQMVVTVDAEA